MSAARGSREEAGSCAIRRDDDLSFMRRAARERYVTITRELRAIFTVTTTRPMIPCRKSASDATPLTLYADNYCRRMLIAARYAACARCESYAAAYAAVTPYYAMPRAPRVMRGVER